MGRIITEERRDQIARAREADPKALGPTLAELMLDGNVPVEIIADYLSVSEPTVYRWMYGESEPRDLDKRVKIQKMCTIMRKAKRAKDLPLQGNMASRREAFRQVVKVHSLPNSAG